MPAKPPPIVTRGPWRSAEPVASPTKQDEHPGWSTAFDVLFNLDGVFDVLGWLWVILRFVGHAVIIVLHAVFHI